jgi:bifunctional UDP-N-acetylglucosamine pyrophosphorylase/glucosamine-1-phosphate N-acetyltransferase
MQIAAVILAAGLGKRMNSSLPKVLHKLYGLTMLQHVLDTIYALNPRKIIVVVGKHFKEIKESLNDSNKIVFAHQKEAKGTGHAFASALPHLGSFGKTILVVNGDTPLITQKMLKRFLELHYRRKNELSVLSFISRDPGSYGRIIRDEKGRIISIVEDRDATASQRQIKEVNSGVYAIEQNVLHLLKKIKLNESKGEYYLTDIVGIAVDEGIKTDAFCIGSEDELIGINTCEELENARQLMKMRIIKTHIKKGVDFIDKEHVFIDSKVKIGGGTIIYPNVYLEGYTIIGKGCKIFPNVRVEDSVIQDGAVIKDSTLIEGSVVKKGAVVGPFAHLRPESEIGAGARIGNFVEVKKSIIGSRTKAQHLTYLGDARVGREVNIGAGTITCNYDGYKKHITTIEDNVFIGSDSQLIAPVKIGKGAYVGAGSTITKDVPPQCLALSRVTQKHIEGWVLKRKLKMKSEKLKEKKNKRR